MEAIRKAIRYLRFSRNGQSTGSIERQELYTDQWLERQGVFLVDTFKDEGRSAKTFDRPDFRKLQDFVERHHKEVDYLLVDQLDRFSRNASEALAYVKMLQSRYHIQIVSITEGIIFDYDTPGSFFRAGLQLLLAEEDNINRSIKVRGGIYTAKAKDGRFIYKNAPFGYRKEGERRERRLVVEPDEAEIVRFIYKSFLENIPLKAIEEEAKKMGFTVKGNVAISRVLTNPVYAGFLKVKSFKEYEGGLFAGNHEPIVDAVAWNIVQQKMAVPSRRNTKIDENVPLRGILRCHCGRKLSGAASRGRHGGYFYYYKCAVAGHNNISAVRAHRELLVFLSGINMQASVLVDIRKQCELLFGRNLKAERDKSAKARQEIREQEEKVKSLEEKYISDRITEETYNRWYPTYNFKIRELTERIISMGQGKADGLAILEAKFLEALQLNTLYLMADTLQKRRLIQSVFYDTLYYSADGFCFSSICESFTTGI